MSDEVLRELERAAARLAVWGVSGIVGRAPEFKEAWEKRNGYRCVP
jgi:hypothetical protein